MAENSMAENPRPAPPAGVVVVDGGGGVRAACARACELLAVERDGLVGRPLAELVPALAGRLPAPGTGPEAEAFSLPGAGLAGQMLAADAGNAAGAVVLLWRDAAHAAPPAETLQRELETIFALSHDGLWIFDGDGRIVNLNRAAEKLNAVRAEDLVGRQVEELEALGIVDISVTKEVMRTRRQVSMSQQARRTGKRILVTGTPSFAADGSLAFVVVNERDETELVLLGQQLEEARQMNALFQEEFAVLAGLESAHGSFVANSPALKEVLRAALKLSRKGVSNILILGESGTGKGKLARFVHEHSDRKSQPFVQINCAALPESVIESELFGYDRGAFTGAKQEGKPGLIEVAEGGTLFLDEMGDMPFSVQAKLLKYLDDGEVRRVGGTRSKVVQCAVVAATNRDLEELVREKRFRHDLFYRLNTFTLRLPPLRDRPDDILPLAHHFLEKYNEKYGTRRRLSHAVADALVNHPFPGNIRELESLIKNAVVMSDSDRLDAVVQALVGRSWPQGGDGKQASASRVDLEAELAAVERALLQRAAAGCRNTREMAAYLSTSQATVVRKLRRHGLPAPGRSAPGSRG